MISKSKLIISAVSVSVMLLITIVFAVTVYSAPSSSTGAIEKASSSGGESCYQKILGYAQMGAYQDKETFNLALSYCSPPSGV
jgi:type II secretory pathway pseudopilin PulG